MLEAEPSSPDSPSDTDLSSEISSSDSVSESDSSDDSRDGCSYRRSSMPPRQHRRDSPRGGRDDSQTPSLLRRKTRHAADAMIAGPHCHLALVETMIDVTTVEVVTSVIVASHSPPGGIVGAATRSRGRRLERVTNVNMSVLRYAKRAHWTGTVLVVTTAEEMVHRTDTWIVGVDEDVNSLGVSTLRVRMVSMSCMYITVILKIPPHPGVFLHRVIWVTLRSFTNDLNCPLSNSKTPKALSLFPSLASRWLLAASKSLSNLYCPTAEFTTSGLLYSSIKCQNTTLNEMERPK